MKTEEPTTKPPIELDSWLSFIVASAAHRSANAGHQKFGELFVQRYFTLLPERYKEDPVATLYFDEMLCAVASAMRGFSVVRDSFQTNLDSLKAAKEAEIKRLEQIDNFSPVAKDGVWGKVVALGVSAGLATSLQVTLKTRFSSIGVGWLIAGLLAVAISVIGLTVFVFVLRNKESRKVEERFPSDVLERWEDRALKGYRIVLKQFLPLAREITERHYPGNYPEQFTDEEATAFIERHFAFKPSSTKPKDPPPQKP